MQSMYICVDQKLWSSFNNIVRSCSNFPSDSGEEETNKNVYRKKKETHTDADQKVFKIPF